MFKQRAAQPSAKRGKNAARHLRYIATREGAVRNAEYTAYIAKRTGAALNENQNFGLFGRYKDIDGTISSLKDAMKYVKQKSEDGTHIYKTIISVKEDDALEHGLDTRDGWEKTIRQHLHIIAKQMDIPMQRFEWMASVHMERGHPHLHLDYWDSDQGVRNYFVTPEKSNDIRQALTRAFFEKEMQPMFQSRKEAKDLLKDEALGILGRVEAGLSREFSAEREKSKPREEILHLRNVQKHFPRYLRQMNDILDAIPKTGSLKRQFMPEDVKEKLRALTEDLMSSNPQCAAAMDDYLAASREITEMYSHKPQRWDEAREKAQAYVYKEIENEILRSLRPLVKARSAAKTSGGLSSEQKASAPEADSGTAFQVSASVLARMNFICDREERQGAVLKGEMSKQAKKEFALKKQGASGIDWER